MGKNTINISAIDGTISVLKNLGISYKITVLGEVIGVGLNDIVFESDIKNILHKESRSYTIRKLEYKDVVILEKMIRNYYFDIDDYILSFEFKKTHEPKEWEIEEK